MVKILLHIPHSSTYMPKDEISNFILSKHELAEELEIMTDLYVDSLFMSDKVKTIKFDYSRLLCDVERFSNDEFESMSKIGMGMVYEKTSKGKLLKVGISDKYKERIELEYYRPHHLRLTKVVGEILNKYNKCVIIDCHSFNEDAQYLKGKEFPDICIGVDDYHTPLSYVKKIKEICIEYGYSVGINKPFSGSIVPLKYYNSNNKVKSIMIELNRKIYMNSNKDFEKVKSLCNKIINEVNIL